MPLQILLRGAAMEFARVVEAELTAAARALLQGLGTTSASDLADFFMRAEDILEVTAHDETLSSVTRAWRIRVIQSRVQEQWRTQHSVHPVKRPALPEASQLLLSAQTFCPDIPATAKLEVGRFWQCFGAARGHNFRPQR